MHRNDEAMIFIGNFNKNPYISIISAAKPKNCVVFAYTYVLRSPALFYGDLCMNLYFVDSDEAMKRGNEALNASSLQFLKEKLSAS
jgi:hypothetical protein